MPEYQLFSETISQKQRLQLQLKSFFEAENIFIKHPKYSKPFFDFENEIIETTLSRAEELEVEEKYMLGKRIEKFFSFYLQCSGRHKLIAENIQIRHDKDTVGELDYLISDNESNTYHIELGYKFYLLDPSISKNQMECWIGPNRNDSLMQKLNKLYEHQFPLFYSKYTSDYLNELNINPKNTQQKLCLKVQLFTPKSFSLAEIKELNPTTIKGHWLYFEDFQKDEFSKSKFFIPDKQDWIIDPEYCDHWIDYEKTLSIIRYQVAAKKSPLVWMKDNNNKSTPIFVVWWKKNN
jgi:hypothetical protein